MSPPSLSISTKKTTSLSGNEESIDVLNFCPGYTGSGIVSTSAGVVAPPRSEITTDREHIDSDIIKIRVIALLFSINGVLSLLPDIILLNIVWYF
jgi:hypothetical protein